MRGDYERGLDTIGAIVPTRKVAAGTPHAVVHQVGPGAPSQTAPRASSHPSPVAAHAAAKAVQAVQEKLVAQTGGATAAQVAAAGNRALAVSRKLSGKLPRAAAKLKAVGTHALNKSRTAVHGDVYQSGAAGRAQGGPMASIAKESLLDPAYVADVNAVSEAGDIASAIIPVSDQLRVAGFTATAKAGDDLVSQAQAIINNFDPSADPIDTSVPGQVDALSSAAASWQSQAQVALSNAAQGVPPVAISPDAATSSAADAGGASGGGGGGSDGGSSDDGSSYDSSADDGSASDDGGDSYEDTLARFRASGGQWDPFSDDGGDGVAPDDGSDGADVLDDGAPPDDSYADDGGDDQGEEVMGSDEFDEFDDIHLDQHQLQITDADVDLERRRASVHHGAGYLQAETYPPWGASSGQEGGRMAGQEETLLFGADYSRGLDILGATPKFAPPRRAGFVVKKTATGRAYTALALNRPRQGDHAASIKNARDAGKRAVSLGNKLLKLANAPTRVHGAVSHHARAGKLLSAVRLKQAATRAIKSGNDSLKSADHHEVLVHNRQTQVNAGAANVKGFLSSTIAKTPAKSGQKIHGEIDDLVYGEVMGHVRDHFGAWCDVFGQDGTTDGTTYVPPPGAASAPDGSAPAPAPSDPTAGLGPAPTSPPPLVAGVDYTPSAGNDDPTIVYSSDPGVPGAPLPTGAIIYDGSRSLPTERELKTQARDAGRSDDLSDYPLGSLSIFAGGPTGEGGARSGFSLHDDGWWTYWAEAYNVALTDLRWSRPSADETKSFDALFDASIKHGWAPIVGNPNSWTKGLRYDRGGKKFFWFRDAAPAWATAPDDQARLNQAILDYKAQVAAAAADAAAKAAQDKLDADNAAALAKQQAAEDAQTARQHEQEQAEAEHQAQLAATQAQAQAAQDQAAAQAQAAQDQAAAQAQIEADRAQRMADIDVEQRAYQAAAQVPIDEAAPDAGEQGYQDSLPDDAQAVLEDDSIPPTDDLADVPDSIEGFELSDVPPPPEVMVLGDSDWDGEEPEEEDEAHEDVDDEMHPGSKALRERRADRR